MLNMVAIVGNLTRDLELRYTPEGKAVVTMGIANNRSFKVGDEFKEETCFVNVVLWGKRAENCAKYLKKGDPVFVSGKLQSRSWEKDGQKRMAIEIIADNIQFLNRSREGTSAEEDKEC